MKRARYTKSLPKKLKVMVVKLSDEFFQREAYLENYEMVIKEQLALASFVLIANSSLVMI